MKLILSLAEAGAIIRSKLNLNPEVIIEIFNEPVSVPATFDWSSDIARVISNIDAYMTPNSGGFVNKISAIREYRNATRCGLKEAKDVIEDWPTQRARIVKLGKFVFTLKD